MAPSLSFLLSADAAEQRMTERNPAFVVHLETSRDMAVADRFVELAAGEIEQAGNPPDAWVDRMGNASAAVRRVMPDGTLHKPCFIK